MAATEAVLAALDKYNALTAANFPAATRPAIYFDEAPPVDSAGASEYPPYVVLKDEGTTPVLEFERQVTDLTTLRFEVYATSLATVNGVITAIRFNGGAVGAGAGFDYGTFPTLAAGYSTVQIKRVSERRFRAGTWGFGAQIIHAGELRYEVLILRTS